jgi:hypothetical protein
MYYESIRQMRKTLAQLDKWLDAGVAFAKTKSFDPNVFLGCRLAPDQFALVRQIQTACDTPKLAASRLTGKEAPKHPDTEQTIDELKARIASVLAYLDSFTPKDFEGTAARTITTPRWEGKILSATEYLFEHALPNFYFHASHTYAILRHNGVGIGKQDYLGQLSLRAP